MKIFAILFVSVFSVSAIAGQTSKQAASRTWIADVTIISPESLDHIEKGSVLIEDGRIVRVERRTRNEGAGWRNGDFGKRTVSYSGPD